MTFKLPTVAQVRSIGATLGMDITDSYAETFIYYISPFADGYRALVALPDETPEVKYPRTSGFRPEGADNKYGAWALKINIKGAKGGKARK